MRYFGYAVSGVLAALAVLGVSGCQSEETPSAPAAPARAANDATLPPGVPPQAREQIEKKRGEQKPPPAPTGKP